MKNFINFLTESQQKNKNTYKPLKNENKELKSTNIKGHKTNSEYADHLRSSDSELFKQYAEEFVKVVNKGGALRKAITDAIGDTNDILNIFYENKIMGFVTGQMIGKIVESVLAKRLNNINGFSYRQTESDKFEKDFICTKIPKNELAGIDIFNGKPDEFFDIELKCSQSQQISGSKSYATDTSKKTKRSFYIFINYNKPGIPDEGENDIDVNKKFSIDANKVNISICYLEQCDWWYSSGGACSPKISMLKEYGRIIKI
jgi:hypothetical protein